MQQEIRGENRKLRTTGAKIQQKQTLRSKWMQILKQLGLNVFVLFSRTEANSWKSAMTENWLFKSKCRATARTGPKG
jgi:hypothetical protein